MAGLAERRERNVAREVRWIARHPKVGKATLWFLVVMAFGQAAMALSFVARGGWGAVAFYAGSTALVVWIARRWADEVRQARLVNEADRA